jgi:hypothetical protein
VAEALSALGRALAAYHFEVEPALWADLEECGVLASAPPAQARAEWECLALHACVRGLVAAAGFADGTADAIDGMHVIVLEQWAAGSGETTASARRDRVAARYDEYGRIGQERESEGPDAVAAALGKAAAAHVFAPASPAKEAASMLADLHAAMTEGATEVARRLTVAGA